MGRAKGQAAAAVLAGGFDAVLGRRRGLTSEDQEALHGRSVSQEPVPQVTYPLGFKEARVFADEFCETDIMATYDVTARDVRRRAFRHLNGLGRDISDVDSTRRIIGHLTRQTCSAGTEENLKFRQRLLSRALDIPCGNAVTGKPFDRAQTKTYEQIWKTLRDGDKLVFEDLCEAAQQNCWDETRSGIAQQIVDRKEEPLRNLLDKKTYGELDKITRGLVTRGRLHRYLNAAQWATVLAEWDPNTGRAGLESAVAAAIAAVAAARSSHS